MVFENRDQAGRKLAREIAKLHLSLEQTVIAAIARGGVVVGKACADELRIPLEVLVIKKLGAPLNPELAIGATASSGRPVLDHWLIRELDVSADWLKREIIKKRKEAASREKFLGITIDERKFSGKVVVVVDDGLATGQTAKAAARVVKQFGAGEVILAVPCASPATVELVKADFNKVVVLEKSEDFVAVGQFYGDFRPVSDEEVKAILL